MPYSTKEKAAAYTRTYRARDRAAVNAKERAYKLRRREQAAGRPRPEVCEVCGELPQIKGLVWDHDHETGLFRGWLCGNCNVALGLVKDSSAILQHLIEYLQGHRHG